MKDKVIAFIGDSITEGKPGVNYVDMIIDKYPHNTYINYGVGGDTIKSIYKRMKQIDLSGIDIVVFFVGINDIYGKLNMKYKVIKRLMKQPYVSSIDEFKERYNEAISYLTSKVKKVYVVPPLLLGEDVNSKWNKEVEVLRDIEKSICDTYTKVTFISMREKFLQALNLQCKISKHLPESILELKKDVDLLDNPIKIDSKSKERGLLVTLDGVHLNSVGATIVADTIIEYMIQKNEVE